MTAITYSHSSMSLGTLIKISLSAVMLLIVFQYVEVDQLIHTASQIPLWCALVTVVGYVVGQTMSAYKWMWIARSARLVCNYAGVLKAYFIGMFVNSFGLGIVGGDVARGLLISENRQSKSLGIATVFADRVHGLAILALLGVGATVFFAAEEIGEKMISLLLIIFTAVIIGWFFGPRIAKRFFPEQGRIWRKVDQLKAALPSDPGTLLIISLISAAFHLLQICLHWVIGLGLGVEIPLSVLLVSVPFVNILSSLPISWNGLGVREGGYIFFLCSLYPYLTEEQALVMGAIWLLAVTSSSAIGGLIAFLSKDFSALGLRTPEEKFTSA